MTKKISRMTIENTEWLTQFEMVIQGTVNSAFPITEEGVKFLIITAAHYVADCYDGHDLEGTEGWASDVFRGAMSSFFALKGAYRKTKGKRKRNHQRKIRKGVSELEKMIGLE
jgi:hypothetical protein